MALPDPDTSVGHSFGLEVDGIVIKQIDEVSGLRAQDVVELKQNTSDGKYLTKKLPGRPKAGEVTLTRGVTGGYDFANWLAATDFGSTPKRGVLVVYDHEGVPIKRYRLTAAWPKSLEPGSLKAGDTSALTEKLVVAYEAMEVE
jgi:phage tail-like protein